MKKNLLSHAKGAWQMYRYLKFTSAPEEVASKLLKLYRDKAVNFHHLWSLTSMYMRWSAIVIGITCCTAVTLYGSNAIGQNVLEKKLTVDFNNTPLKEALDKLEELSGAGFAYGGEVYSTKHTITSKVQSTPLKKILDDIFNPIPFSYQAIGEEILVRYEPGKLIQNKTSPQSRLPTPEQTVTGTVSDTLGLPLPGVTVHVKGTNMGTATDAKGQYTIAGLESDAILTFRMIGFQLQEVAIGNRSVIDIILKERVSELDEAIVIGYGTTSRRLNTGNVSKVSKEIISQQPITNPLQALAGRVAGLQITQRSGLPGDGVTVQIRGRNSITASNDPLYIVDGVPFPSTQIESFNVGSPINSISPSDIESIEILKDADATSIYGSRASNGVILITTKKGKTGKTSVDINIQSGISEVSRKMDLLNTQQYIQVRQDAFINSNVTPTIGNAPDLLIWDQSANFDWQKWYMGNTASNTLGNVSMRGGNQQTTFLISGTIQRENTVRYDDNFFRRVSGHLNLNHTSINEKMRIQFSSFYTASNNFQNSGAQMLSVYREAPNYPVYDEDGRYNWTGGRINHLAADRDSNLSKTNNLNSSFRFEYQILPELSVKTDFGYNRIQNEILSKYPSISTNPSQNRLGRSNFGNQFSDSYLIEPQVRYNKTIDNGILEILAGSTIQNRLTQLQRIYASNFTNDILLESIGFAGDIAGMSSSTDYKYRSFFGRLNYNLQDKYILNASLRRDGSSRFGPNKRFGNFGSVGVAWIFSEESALRNKFNWLSFGKLRGSWGTTGNDGIGDYQYLNTYGSSVNYNNEVAIIPSRLANADYSWEINKKLEFALELGFYDNRVLFNTARYQNRSANQLVAFALPATTGFSNYTANLPALVENTGWEFDLNLRNIENKTVKWSTVINLTVPRNKLVKFPGLETSSYANNYVIGKSLNIIQGFNFLGVNQETGLTMVEDINNDGVFTQRSSYNNQGGDYVIIGKFNPDWYGGINNTISFKSFHIDIFFQYIQQQGYNTFRRNTAVFGRLANVSTDFLEYWKAPGDITSVPKPFALANPSLTQYQNSSAGVSDASFLRLKNVNLSYSLPRNITQRLNINQLSVYIQGQNLWTMTKFMDLDPEFAASSPFTTFIPTLRTFNLGIKCNL